jgi:hypothetical protein
MASARSCVAIRLPDGLEARRDGTVNHLAGSYRTRAARRDPLQDLDQSVTWEPTVTVRSIGSPKASMGLAALRAIAMNSSLRHRRIPDC